MSGYFELLKQLALEVIDGIPLDAVKIIAISDSTSRSILHLFKQLSDRHPMHLQWVPSHVGLSENEVADDLAKVAASDPIDPEDHIVLTSTEIYSRAKELICKT
ncbi:RNase H domain-containing protein [Trichonephila clavipes]|nr:RNase H domain-containing protein [Trichonephila clavipes]